MYFMIIFAALALGMLLGTALIIFALAARKMLPGAMSVLFVILGAGMDLACLLMAAGILSAG